MESNTDDVKCLLVERNITETTYNLKTVKSTVT